MASFIYNSFYYGFRFTEAIDLSNPAKIVLDIKKVIGNDFKESIARSDGDTDVVEIVLDSIDGIIRLSLKSERLIVFVSSVDSEKIDEENALRIKDLSCKLLEASVLPDEYENAFFSASGCYFPVTASKKQQSRAAVLSIVKKIAGQKDEDISDVTLGLKRRTDYGMSGVDYEVVENKPTDMYALSIDIGLLISRDVGLKPEDLLGYLNTITAIGELENERKKIDTLARR